MKKQVDNISSVYIHIPFCKKICSYCDFCKVFYNNVWANKYLDALEKEIKKYYKNELIRTIYIGGGTPSSLNSKCLEKLFDIIKIFKINNTLEFTFECNLNDITDELLKNLKNNNVNRISIGIETFNKKLLELMNRESNYLVAKEKINLCHKYGIHNINVDLIYGFNNETKEDLKEDLELFASLDITHISTYSLILENNTILKYKNYLEIDENIDADMYEYICSYLKNNGFNHYEVSNFCKKNYASRHNLVYWNNERYYGFGLGSASFIENKRIENTRSLNKYLDGNYRLNETVLDKNDLIYYELILGFRKLSGINIKNINDKYNIDLIKDYSLDKLIKNNDLIIKNGNIFINTAKIYIMNEILLKIL